MALGQRKWHVWAGAWVSFSFSLGRRLQRSSSSVLRSSSPHNDPVVAQKLCNNHLPSITCTHRANFTFFDYVIIVVRLEKEAGNVGRAGLSIPSSMENVHNFLLQLHFARTRLPTFRFYKITPLQFWPQSTNLPQSHFCQLLSSPYLPWDDILFFMPLGYKNDASFSTFATNHVHWPLNSLMWCLVWWSLAATLKHHNCTHMQREAEHY